MRNYLTLLLVGLIISMSSVTSWAEVLSPAEGGKIPISNVAGKKLIRAAREGRHFCQDLAQIEERAKKAQFVQENVQAWQDKGVDGMTFTIKSGQWWRIPPLTYEEIQSTIEAFKSVKDWGRLTDNFLWTSSSVWVNTRAADWLSDEDWTDVLTNTRLAARLAKECRFKGIVLDMEQYNCHSTGVWRIPFNYKRYATEGYKVAGEANPRPFLEMAAIVRQRGKQYAEALTSVYPDIVLFVFGLYENTWREVLVDTDGLLTDTSLTLWPAFVDGLLLGLDERATLISATEATYCDTRYKDMLFVRDQALRQSLVLSTVPELARKRITFSVGIWTDAGWGPDRFSDTDVRVNQRDPECHKHAVHNALAASDKYAWLYGEMPWLTAKPTHLMQQYWQATREGRHPQDLSWGPEPNWDFTDYTEHNAKMSERDAAFWTAVGKEGWKVAVELPIQWRFWFDADNQLRYRSYLLKNTNDSSWFFINSLKCWQSQGTVANGAAVYRTRFDAPADLDPAIQEIVLAFGEYSPGSPKEETGLFSWMDVTVNGKGYPMKHLIDVSGSIKPGESNLVAVRVVNKSGPAGLMGSVKLMIRDGKSVLK